MKKIYKIEICDQVSRYYTENYFDNRKEFMKDLRSAIESWDSFITTHKESAAKINIDIFWEK